METKFDKDYYENGIVTSRSCYVNYRWLPELTIKMAYNIIRCLHLIENEKVLDFGCAKGYLVKAFRILDIDAYGCDISEYAMENVDTDVRNYCKLVKSEDFLIPFDFNFQWIISKDVLEHLNEKQLDNFIKLAYKKSDKMFHVIPLGNGRDNFVVPEYELDKTHILRMPPEWWIDKFKAFGWKAKLFEYKIKGVKENWTEKYEKGNGFFIFKK